jgi:hypothetical protein
MVRFGLTGCAGLRELSNCELAIDACGAKVKKIDFCGVSKLNVGSACGQIMFAEARALASYQRLR